MIPNTQDKIEAVEALIEAFRHTSRTEEDERRIVVFKAIAADLRARLSTAPSVALHEIERRMTAVRRHPVGSGSARVNAQVGVAEELVGRWPVVKQALEQFAANLEGSN